MAWGAAAAAAAPEKLADRIARAERMQDWETVATLSSRFALAEREDLFVLTAILNACVARKCDEAALVKRLRGPLVDAGIREFAAAWLEYVARDQATARRRFEALWASPATAWLGIFGRLSYATDARNAALLRDALRDAKANPELSRFLSEEIREAESTLSSLSGAAHDERDAGRSDDKSIAALMARFGRELAADDFSAARKTLDRYASLWGEDQDVVVARLELMRVVRPPREVVEAARRELRAHPRYWRIRYALAQALVESDDEKAARSVFSQGVPTAFAQVRSELAATRADFGDLSPADRDAALRELENFADYPFAQAAIAALQLRSGNVDAAKAALDRADAMTPDLPGTLGVRADIARAEGRIQEVVRLREKMASRYPTSVSDQLSLGYAYAAAGDRAAVGRVAALLRRSPRYVSRDSIELLEQIAAEP